MKNEIIRFKSIFFIIIILLNISFTGCEFEEILQSLESLELSEIEANDIIEKEGEIITEKTEEIKKDIDMEKLSEELKKMLKREPKDISIIFKNFDINIPEEFIYPNIKEDIKTIKPQPGLIEIYFKTTDYIKDIINFYESIPEDTDFIIEIQKEFKETDYNRYLFVYGYSFEELKRDKITVEIKEHKDSNIIEVKIITSQQTDIEPDIKEEK